MASEVVTYRAFAAAVIQQAVSDAANARTQLDKRPPRSGRNRVTYLYRQRIYWRHRLSVIRFALRAHRFLSDDTSLWWSMADLDREVCQRAWRAAHRIHIAALTALDPYAQRKAEEYATKYRELVILNRHA